MKEKKNNDLGQGGFHIRLSTIVNFVFIGLCQLRNSRVLLFTFTIEEMVNNLINHDSFHESDDGSDVKIELLSIFLSGLFILLIMGSILLICLTVHLIT